MSYQRLTERFKQLGHLEHAMAMLQWDDATLLPSGSAQARADAQAGLAVMHHQQLTSSNTPDLLAAAAIEDLDDWQNANLAEMRRLFIRGTAIPDDLITASTLASSRCGHAWRKARAANDWQSVLPLLEEVVNLQQQQARGLADALSSDALSADAPTTAISPYDALLDGYQPGITSAEITGIFADLESFLPNFLDQVIERQRAPIPLPAEIPIERQAKLATRLMTVLGFDFARGRLDVSHHPFCGGVPDDVRITTRYSPESYLSAIMAVLHETGHALYEQGLPGKWRGHPVGQAMGSATHESQSLIMEMQACRSAEFLRFAAPLYQQELNLSLTNDSAWSADNLLAHASCVSRGYIRVDADEVSYPLHVILRFNLEQALLSGDLQVRDVPDAWNEGMQRYLGLSTQGNYQNGCMQDVHWFEGLFGYFPTYTLGAMMAAQLFAAARLQDTNILPAIERGDFSPLVTWLRTNIHSQGSRLGMQDLLLQATGETLNPEYFRNHLQTRYAVA